MRALTPKETIEERIRSGILTRNQVYRTERFWRRNLRDGITIADNQSVRMTLDDVYHTISGEPQFAREPQRLRRALEGVFELRKSYDDRILGFTRWEEGIHVRIGSVVINPDGTIQTMHIQNDRRLDRYRREYPERLWQRDQ